MRPSLHRDSSYLDDFIDDGASSYFDENSDREGGLGADVSGDGSGGGGCFVRGVCFVGNVCLAFIGLLMAVLPQLLRPTVVCSCLQPLMSGAGLGLKIAVACLPLSAGLAGFAASVASRRARLGHAVAAVLATCCALTAANAGVLLARDQQLSEHLLTACGGASDQAALGIGAGFALLLLGHAGLSWTCYYKYSRASAYDGQYNLAKLRRQQWRRRRLQKRQRQRQQLLLMQQTQGRDVGERRLGRRPLLPLQAGSQSGFSPTEYELTM